MDMPEDLAAFCAREHPRLVGALSLHVRDSAVAEELAQEAFERVCQRWETVRDMQSPSGWLHRVGFNLANSGFRRRAAERRAYVRAAEPDDRRHEPEEPLVVREALAQLPTAQRQVVVLRYFLGYSVQEAGTQMGRSEGAIQQLTFRAMRTLRAQLELPDHESEDVDAGSA